MARRIIGGALVAPKGRSGMRGAVLLMSLATAAPVIGCTAVGSNGDRFSDNDRGRTFQFIGLTNLGSTATAPRTVRVEVLQNPSDTNPPVWKSLGSTTAPTQIPVSSSPSTNFTNDAVHGSLFSWQLGDTLLNQQVPASAWRPGGALTYRVFGDLLNNDVSPAQVMTNVQFAVGDDDFIPCVNSQPSGTPWYQVGARCLSRYPAQAVHVLDTSHNPGLNVTPGTTSMANSPRFLSRTSGRLGPNLPKAAEYYLLRTDRIPQTLSGFRALYNLAPNSPGAVTTTYYNHGDLGLGRRMTCNRFGPTLAGVACAVTNYTGYTDSNRDAQGKLKPFGAYAEQLQGAAVNEAVSDAVNNQDNHALATVAMAYDPSKTEKVIFAAYNGKSAGFRADVGGASASEALVTEAVLDNVARLDKTVGNVDIPGNCLTCHGGSAVALSPSREVLGAMFLPFDLENFRYATTAPNRQIDQEANFRAQNKMVRDVANGVQGTATQTMVKLIEGWYGGQAGLNGTTATFNAAFVPTGWEQTQQNPSPPTYAKKLYENVIQPYCQTCHIAQGASSLNPPLDFASFAVFNPYAPAAEAAACPQSDNTNEHMMPHAELTMKHFWESPARAHLLSAISSTRSCGSNQANQPIR